MSDGHISTQCPQPSHLVMYTKVDIIYIFLLILLSYLFLTLFIASNLILFGGVYWSKFAHMFYKPGAAIQKNLAEADGSRDNLPPPADAPEQFGLGIKREEPKHY